MRKAKDFQKSDERILGDGDFVQSVLLEAGESLEQKYVLKSKGYTVDKIAQRVTSLSGVDVKDI